MEAPLVSVGIVTFNSAVYLPACLDALGRQSHTAVELIVVDNVSSDDSVALVGRRCPGAQVICNSANAGFSGAHNQAIRTSRGKYYLALNPDVVMSEQYIAALVKTLEEHPRGGAAMGKLLQMHEPTRLDSTGLYIRRNGRQVLRGHGELDIGQYDQFCEVFGVDGAAPLYRRAMLEDVREGNEFFDETLFAYKEDVDLAWRARWLGWSSWYEPCARALHARTFRPGARRPDHDDLRRYSVRNRYLVLLKNEPAHGWRRDAVRILFYDLQILGYLVLREQRSLRAFLELPSMWREMLRKRRALACRARIPPAEMLQWLR